MSLVTQFLRLKAGIKFKLAYAKWKYAVEFKYVFIVMLRFFQQLLMEIDTLLCFPICLLWS